MSVVPESVEMWSAENSQLGGQASPAVPPAIKSIADLQRAGERIELLRDWALCQGEGMLVVGPPTSDTTALVVQAALMWAQGEAFFGIRPVRPLRILLIQRESDDDQLAEIRDGVAVGLQLRPEQVHMACHRVHVVTEHAQSGPSFCTMLDDLLARHPSDLVILDRANTRAGHEAIPPCNVTSFLRGGINPVIRKHGCGLLAVVHTRGIVVASARKRQQQPDLDSDGIDWCSWARAVLELRPCGAPEVFELVASKRVAQLGWTDEDQVTPRPMTRIARRHAGDRIFWTTFTDILRPFAPAKKDVMEASDESVISVLGETETIPRREFERRVRQLLGLGVNRAKSRTSALIAAGKLEAIEAPRSGTRPRIDVSRTPTVQPVPPASDATVNGEIKINWGDRTDIIRNGEIVRDQRADLAGQNTTEIQ